MTVFQRSLLVGRDSEICREFFLKIRYSVIGIGHFFQSPQNNLVEALGKEEPQKQPTALTYHFLFVIVAARPALIAASCLTSVTVHVYTRVASTSWLAPCRQGASVRLGTGEETASDCPRGWATGPNPRRADFDTHISEHWMGKQSNQFGYCQPFKKAALSNSVYRLTFKKTKMPVFQEFLLSGLRRCVLPK